MGLQGCSGWLPGHFFVAGRVFKVVVRMLLWGCWGVLGGSLGLFCGSVSDVEGGCWNLAMQLLRWIKWLFACLYVVVIIF